jgi:exopolyphosphatase/guanosine-5'-triphosphate,3'-diphosphate pyrophosphatase
MVAIDLGSNTIRMIEYDCDKKEVLNSFEKIVKTADKLVDSGVISDETIDRIVKAIEEAKEKLNFTDVVAVTTEALRQAKNQDEVLKIVKEKTGVEFKIISADEEAYYTTIATEEVIAKRYRYKNMFLVDIGGGSTELILKNKKELISESFQIGIVTISQKYKSIEALEYGIKKDVKPFKDFINFIKASYMPDIFVASSGTPTTIAALKIGLDYETYDPQKVNGVVLEIKDLDFWLNELLKMERSKREKLVGVGRGDLIVSGIMIFKEIFLMSGFKRCIVSDNGVREGVAIDYCKNRKKNLL